MFSTNSGVVPPKPPAHLHQTIFSESEMTVAESLQRSRERKKRRIDVNLMVCSKGSLSCVQNCLNSPVYSDLSKCLLRKMLDTGLLDDCTEPMAIQCIAEHANDMFAATFQCKDGNGFELIRNNGDRTTFRVISDVLRSNYSSLKDSEEKCIYWTMCAAFLVMYYEVHSDLVFNLPLSYAPSDFEKFLRRYPEFLLRTWDTNELLTFQLCMKRAVQCFGNGNNMGCLTELVTRIVKGRETALTCNTSGGGLRNYDHPTEVSTEKCRILIYQRESGIMPRTRKSKGCKRKFCPGDATNSMNISMMSGPRGGVMDMMPATQRLYNAGLGGGQMSSSDSIYLGLAAQGMFPGASYPPPQNFYQQNYDMTFGHGGMFGGDNTFPGQQQLSNMQMGMDQMYMPQGIRQQMLQPPGSAGYDMINSYSFPGMQMPNNVQMPQFPSQQNSQGITGGGISDNYTNMNR